MAMSKESMVQKVKDAYNARTGETMSDSEANVLIDLCQGIIEEITANGQVTVIVSGGSSSGSHSGTIS